MTLYLISFPSEAMDVTAEELPTVAEESRAVIREARAAGVLVVAGGIDESVEPVTVSADGALTPGASMPQTARIEGGYTILNLPSRAEAEHWAARIAAACRCPQELREFQHDPESLP